MPNIRRSMIHKGAVTAADIGATDFIEEFLTAVDPADAQDMLQLIPGEDVQPYDADLTALAALPNGVPYRSAGSWGAYSLGDLSTSGSSLVVSTVGGRAVTATPAGGVVPVSDGSSTLDSWISGAVKGVRTNVIFVYVLPQAGTSVNLDGSGPSPTVAGVLTPSQAEADYFCTQFGDASAFYARWYATGGYQTSAGTTVLNFNFRVGSDTTGSTQFFFAGLSNTLTLNSANPSTGTVDMGCIRYDVTTATFKLCTRDNVTTTDTETNVAVTPSYYYMVEMQFTATSCTARIGRGVSPTAAATNFLEAGTTVATGTLPRSTQGLSAVMSHYRGAGSGNRCFKFNYFRMTITPSWAT